MPSPRLVPARPVIVHHRHDCSTMASSALCRSNAVCAEPAARRAVGRVQRVIINLVDNAVGPRSGVATSSSRPGSTAPTPLSASSLPIRPGIPASGARSYFSRITPPAPGGWAGHRASDHRGARQYRRRRPARRTRSLSIAVLRRSARDETARNREVSRFLVSVAHL